MNTLLAICGLVCIGTATTPNSEQTNAQRSTPTNELKCQLQTMPVKLVKHSIYVPKSEISFLKDRAGLSTTKMTTVALDLNKIVFLEDEEQIDLGFDAADYLPEDFDPDNVYVDLDKVTYLECEEDSLLDFNSAAYLPKDFNPYTVPADIRSISYIEEEPVINIDTAAYLPEGFDPYAYYFDIHSIEYLEEEDIVELDFNTKDYLPRGFDPYSR